MKHIDKNWKFWCKTESMKFFSVCTCNILIFIFSWNNYELVPTINNILKILLTPNVVASGKTNKQTRISTPALCPWLFLLSSTLGHHFSGSLPLTKSSPSLFPKTCWQKLRWNIICVSNLSLIWANKEKTIFSSFLFSLQ